MQEIDHCAPYKVYWWDPEGNTHCEGEGLDAGGAVDLAKSLTMRPAAVILKVIRKIMITDNDDFGVFLWQDGEVKFPHASRDTELRGDH